MPSDGNHNGSSTFVLASNGNNESLPHQKVLLQDRADLTGIVPPGSGDGSRLTGRNYVENDLSLDNLQKYDNETD